MRRIVAVLVASIRIAFRAFDLDDVGAEVGQHHAGAGTRDERALFDDADAAKHRVEHQALGHESGRSRAVVRDAGRAAVGEHEADRPFLFLEQVRHQAAVRARIGTPLTASTG